MMFSHLKRSSGFTLVEVIVVAVIVSALAIIGVLLYRGYVVEARMNTADNVAASAAGFLNSAENVDVSVPNASIQSPLTGEGKWILLLPSGYSSTFQCPANVTVSFNSETKTVFAVLRGVSSDIYRYGVAE